MHKVFIFFLFLLLSCNNQPESTPGTLKAVVGAPDALTRTMIQKVLDAEARVNSANIDFYLNSRRAKFLETQMGKLQIIEIIEHKPNYSIIEQESFLSNLKSNGHHQH